MYILQVKCVRPEASELHQLVQLDLNQVKVAIEIAATAASAINPTQPLMLPNSQLLDIIAEVVGDHNNAKQVFTMIVPSSSTLQANSEVSSLNALLLLVKAELDTKLQLLWQNFEAVGVASVTVERLSEMINHILHCWYLRPPSAETVDAQVTYKGFTSDP